VTDSEKIRVGVIGCGQWGPNHVRVFNSSPDAEVVACSDLDPGRLDQMRSLYPHIRTTTEYWQIIQDPEIDAVVLATPTATHFKLVGEALQHGKDVLVEKPLSDSLQSAEKLAKLAQQKKRILMVGHTFMFNSGIRKLREYMQSGKLGRIYYLNAVRTNLGPIRHDVSSVWDLASHDISIFNYLLDAQPLSVSARGEDFIQPGLEDVAFLTLSYPKRVLVNIHVSWLNPRKVREITAVGEKMMVVWDDLDNVGPIRIYDKKVERKGFYESFGEFQLLIKEGDLTIPKLHLVEPLKAQGQHFLSCIRSREKPTSDGRTGVDVVRALTAIKKSIDKGGASVALAKGRSRTKKTTIRSPRKTKGRRAAKRAKA
jgi:predicted dehydrogenase